MPRRSALLWIGLGGIFLFLGGIFLDRWNGYERKVHLKLGSPEQILRNPKRATHTSSPSAADSFSLRLDSLHLKPASTSFELQVRKANTNFEPQFHPNVMQPSMLEKALPLQPMKIQQIGDTPYRFRLKEFYPDFTFEYTYPAQQDTIAPKAPGISLNLKTPHGEEVLTLRADQPNMRGLDDVVQLGCALEFYWDNPPVTMPGHADSSARENKITFLGKDKKILFHFNDTTSTLSLELNRFYSIPGTDSLGFTILQCFPDFAYLKAEPASKSEKLNNPVAAVEVWKLKGLSQEIYLYPTTSSKPTGQWSVPGTDLLLTLGYDHVEMLKKCNCYMTLMDSTKNVHKRLEFNGGQTLSFEGNRISPVECDPNGFWATLAMRNNPGELLKMSGVLITMATLFFSLFGGIKMQKRKNGHVTFDDHDQLPA